MNCPFCDAPLKPNWPSYPRDPWFTCGTMIHDAQPTRLDQTNLCVESEIARLKARIARLEEAGERVAYARDEDDLRAAIQAWEKAKEAKP